MMQVIIRPAAKRDIKKLDDFTKRIIKQALLDYVAGKHTDYKKLRGYGNLYRIRVNEYRIILEVVFIENTAYVIRVAHRRDVYRGL